MEVDSLNELTTLRGLIEAADLPEDARQSALWCLRQLPGPYREFARTYDSRHADEALRLANATLDKVASSSVAAEVRAQLVDLHERLGLGDFHLKAPKPPPRKTRKAS